jgi:hypothetical protein
MTDIAPGIELASGERIDYHQGAGTLGRIPGAVQPLDHDMFAGRPIASRSRRRSPDASPAPG